MKDQEQCNQLVLDLARDMACTLGYIEDVKQFARLAQLKQAILDVTPLMEDTTNFIVEFNYDGGGSWQHLYDLIGALSRILRTG